MILNLFRKPTPQQLACEALERDVAWRKRLIGDQYRKNRDAQKRGRG